MSSIFLVIVFIALNVVPARVAVFDMVDPTGAVMRWTKQPTGGWQVVALPHNAQPQNDFGAYSYVDQVLTITPPESARIRKNAKPISVPIWQALKLPETVDWAKTTNVALSGGGSAALTRKETTVAVDVSVGSGGEGGKQQFIIRWEKPAEKP